MVGERHNDIVSVIALVGFSLVAEIGWLARFAATVGGLSFAAFQSRCRDWVVGEAESSNLAGIGGWRFSLVAEIGWLASCGVESQR